MEKRDCFAFFNVDEACEKFNTISPSRIKWKAVFHKLHGMLNDEALSH